MKEAVIDACCTLNLAAAGVGDLMAILPHLGFRFRAPKVVLDEPRFLWRIVDDERIDIPVDLSPAVDSGWITPCEIETPEELILFVEIASRLKDSDAACLTLAVSRGLPLATDDGKILKIAREYGVPSITTPSLLKDWADSSPIERMELVRIVRNVDGLANFRPKVGSIYHAWWIDLADAADG